MAEPVSVFAARLPAGLSVGRSAPAFAGQGNQAVARVAPFAGSGDSGAASASCSRADANGSLSAVSATGSPPGAPPACRPGPVVRTGWSGRAPAAADRWVWNRPSGAGAAGAGPPAIRAAAGSGAARGSACIV